MSLVSDSEIISEYTLLKPRSPRFAVEITSYTQLQARYSFSNRQRPVSSLGVSQHMHQITKLWKFKLSWSLKMQVNSEEEKKTLLRRCVWFQMTERGFRPGVLIQIQIFLWKCNPFSKTTLLQRTWFTTMFYSIISSQRSLPSKSSWPLVFDVITKSEVSLL